MSVLLTSKTMRPPSLLSSNIPMILGDFETTYGQVRVSTFGDQLLVVCKEGPLKGQYFLMHVATEPIS